MHLPAAIRSPIMDVPDVSEMDIYLTSNEIRSSQLDVYLGALDIQHICPTITLNVDNQIKKEIKEEMIDCSDFDNAGNVVWKSEIKEEMLDYDDSNSSSLGWKTKSSDEDVSRPCYVPTHATIFCIL